MHPDTWRPAQDDECRGNCFREIAAGYSQECKQVPKCMLRQCPVCRWNFPLEFLLCNDGMCFECSREYYMWYMKGFPFRPKGFCVYCCVRLPLIMNENGNFSLNPREYHYKCWERIQQEDGADSMSDSDSEMEVQD